MDAGSRRSRDASLAARAPDDRVAHRQYDRRATGEAWSDWQGWVEGGLRSSERLLQGELGIGPPDWLAPGAYLGPERAGIALAFATMPGKLSDLMWGPLFARAYDYTLKGSEDAGLREKRRDLLARAKGRTLEIGAGTGGNLELYPDSVTELVLIEPDRHMRAQLERRVAGASRRPEIVDAGGERLPFDDASFDTAITTLVLCTIPDPRTALAEVARVLKPEGRFLFIEHVRAEDPGAARWQDRLERPWGWFGRGCHPNRDTVATIDASPLELVEVERDRMPKAPPIVRPMAVGEARPSTSS